MNIPIPVSQVKTKNLIMLVYGGPGVGKSIFAGSSQRYRTLILDIDDGLSSVKNWQARKTKADMIPIRTRKEFMDAYAWLLTHKDKYDLVVVDTATELQRMILQEFCDESKVAVPGRPEWNLILTIMETITRNWRHMPFHVLYCCHEHEEKDQDQRKMWVPNFKGQFAENYAKHFSEIWRYMMVEKRSKMPDGTVKSEYLRFLDCHKDPANHCKHRGQVLAKYEQPDIDLILGKITGLIAPTTQNSENTTTTIHEGVANNG